MRFSCKSCLATFQTATGAPAVVTFRCPSCNGEMAAVAEVVDLWQDRIPTRRYDLDDLRARLTHEKEEAAKTRVAPRSPDQVWFAAVQGRQVGPLSAAGIAGLRARGQLSAASLVWREGWSAWVAAEAVEELRTILGLPEEKLGQPFPVRPAAPAPPPIDSTYAAAHAPPSDDLLEQALAALGEKTDPAAHLPPAPFATQSDLPAAPAESESAPSSTPEENPATANPTAESLRDGASDAAAVPLEESARLEESLPAAPSAAQPLEVRAPPSLPHADAMSLEDAASSVFAQARGAPDAAAELPPSSEPAQVVALHGARESAPGAVERDSEAYPSEAAPSGTDAARPDAAPSPIHSEPVRAASASAEQEAPPPMIDLSAAAGSSDELPAARRARRQQQDWFSAAEEPREPPLRSRTVLAVALVIALVALALALRSH